MLFTELSSDFRPVECNVQRGLEGFLNFYISSAHQEFSPLLRNTHTHTHTHVYIHIYIYMRYGIDYVTFDRHYESFYPMSH